MVKRQEDEHEFMVAGVELAAGKMIQGIAITLIDARGGRVSRARFWRMDKMHGP